MTPHADFHVHSNYSDGRPLPEMVAAAERAGLEAVGITDHCNVSNRSVPMRAKREHGFNLDLTYERRREALESLRAATDLAIYDGVELDYDPRDEPELESFLEQAGFDYAIGSVHELDGACIFDRSAFADRSESERRDLVDDYYRKIVSLLEFDAFDVLGHVDAIERTPELRGYATTEHYHRVADALVESSSVLEINAGRVGREYGSFHPEPSFLEILRDRNVRFVPGSDAHRPAELVDRVPLFADRFVEAGLESTSPIG
ncbi:PHP domain-containing protein [Halosolutus amylolyticus]|uniref:histidinol-phosphatase n=1 Tax=Halosolutus amylolyticus TaxID=2932267 RepID=A0ABD5PS91_9EURY|nr:PHP domain-containing protein [Halosolutus amylolyticus]